ncbi:NB-ARC domains-containing protein [Tanacetum coccineum]
MNNNITKLPDYELLLPHLEVFLISYNYELPMFSDELVQSMKKVKVFDMGYCNQSALLGFQPLTKFRVLNLKDNRNVVDISIFWEMKDLEILILSGTRIKKIPQEIGRLVNLRRLDVLGCRHLNHVADGVISKLSRLEELRIPFTLIYMEPRCPMEKFMIVLLSGSLFACHLGIGIVEQKGNGRRIGRIGNWYGWEMGEELPIEFCEDGVEGFVERIED